MYRARRAQRTWFTLSGAVIGVACLTEPALACSPPPPTPGYADWGSTIPSNGATNVPLDAAIAVDINHYGGIPDATEVATLTDSVTGESVPGTSAEYYWGRSFLGFKPTTLLAPNHRYLFEAAITTTVARPENASGNERVSIAFTTGESAAPALEVVGKMQVELEDYEAPDYSTCSPGMCTCTPTVTKSDTRAKITLPGAQGGQSERGYFALVMVTRTEPYIFGEAANSTMAVQANGTAVVGSEPGATMTIGGLASADPYVPCFALQIRDLAGQKVVGEPLCLSDTLVHPRTNTGSTGVPPATGGTGGVSASGGAAFAGAAAAAVSEGGAAGAQATSGNTPVDAVGSQSHSTADDGCTLASTSQSRHWQSLVGLIGILALARKRNR